MLKNKALLREQMRRLRAAVTRRNEKDAAVSEKLFELLAKEAIGSVFIYVSMNSEVDTRRIIPRLFELGIKVSIPNTCDGTMSVRTLELLPVNFKTDKLGNLEGSENFRLNPRPCDCAVVPMLAYNKKLYRLGYGGGYYDRFLADFSGIKIGLAYSDQLCENFEEENHDVPMDTIITDRVILEREEQN